ncbi:MAG: DUF4215 domain-containing protein, partial [Deltaproteobacteria bacterium]|nr:DUF4215 domain-containing protein [Deltaproteobacteria bacterium]
MSKQNLSCHGLVVASLNGMRLKVSLAAAVVLFLCLGFNLRALAAPGCGDGIVQPPEACDDGNTFLGDGCTPLCALVTETTGTARIHSIRFMRVGDNRTDAYFYFKPDANTVSKTTVGNVYTQVNTTYSVPPVDTSIFSEPLPTPSMCHVQWSTQGASGAIMATKFANGFFKAALPVSRTSLPLNYTITCRMNKVVKTTTITTVGARKTYSTVTVPAAGEPLVIVPFETKQLQYNPATEQFAHLSISRDGALINGKSGEVTAISGEGDVIAFDSKSTTLISGDAGDALRDVYKHELATGEIQKISGGNNANDNDAYYPAMSADGRFVAFATTNAETLDGGARSGFVDILVKDQTSGTVERISVSTSGGVINKTCYNDLSISADGRYVAFRCAATNLVAGDTNLADDMFVRDRQQQKTFRVSVSSAGVQARSGSASSQPVISLDGKYVVFASTASTLVSGDTNGKKDIFLHDFVNHTTTLISVGTINPGETLLEHRFPSISRDGRYVSYTVYKKMGTTTTRTDVYVYDRVTNTSELVSKSSSGEVANKGADKSQISADGRYVLFASASTNLSLAVQTSQTSLYIRDRKTAQTTLLGKAIPYGTFNASGEYISFWTNNSITAAKLVPWMTKPAFIEIFRMKNPVWVEQECGDGFVQRNEQCDDGGTVAGDGCNATCQEERCGDAIVNNDRNATDNAPAEFCDDGNNTAGDGCNATCVAEICGDGVVNNNGAEQCDDGNNIDTDACLTGTCVVAA